MNQIVPASERRRAGLGIAQTIIETAGSPQPARISIADNRFTLIDDDASEIVVPTHHVDVVFVGMNPRLCNQYYDEPFVPGAKDFKPPACWSDDGIAPSAQASKPQSEKCASCPQAVWGSKINKQTGVKRRACDQFYRTAVIVGGDAKEKAWRFDVKGGSFSNLRAYAKYLAQQTIAGRAGDLSDVLTRIEFESQGVMKFTAIAVVNDHLSRVFDNVLESGAVDGIVGLTDFKQQIAAPAKVAQIEAPKDMFNGGGQVSAPSPKNGDFGWQAKQEEQKTAATGRGRPAGAKNKAKEQPAQESEADALKRQIAEMQAKLDAAKAPKGLDDNIPFDDKDIPDFLKRGRLAPQQTEGMKFGMDPNPAAPNAALQNMLDDAFNLKV